FILRRLPLVFDDGQNYKTRFCGIQMRRSQYAAVDAVLILAVTYLNFVPPNFRFRLSRLSFAHPLALRFHRSFSKLADDNLHAPNFIKLTFHLYSACDDRCLSRLGLHFLSIRASGRE
ncbi:MAG: hypothetical protein J6E31_01235, partial [Pyramidobacter sp.]|nr:hypothetical protein [Pyramidobacter sp.]